MPRPLALLLLLLIGSADAFGQVVVLDEGSFTLYKAGERIGREDFSIRTAPGANGRVLVAQATVASGDRRVAPGINADTLGFPSNYQREDRVAGIVVESYRGRATRGRFASTLLRAEGESAREFRLPAGTVAAEDDIVHHLWFIARRGPGAIVPVLAPRRNAVDSVRVEAAGTERLSIDLRQFETTRLVLRTLSTGAIREVWIGADGRIIKATIPALGITALRD
jgi:hypothetical protein